MVAMVFVSIMDREKVVVRGGEGLYIGSSGDRDESGFWNVLLGGAWSGFGYLFTFRGCCSQRKST